MIEKEKVKRESSLYSNFQKRYNQYSKLWWKLWTSDKSSIEWQSPAFVIRLVDDKYLYKIKQFPDLIKQLQQLNIVFQYIKYSPKKAMTEYAKNKLDTAKLQFHKLKQDRIKRGLPVVWLKMPTRDSLWITRELEHFKETYPKITYRKSDWSIDVIKSDWKWYLITSIDNGTIYEDWHVLWQNFFFKNPATMKATLKEDIDERVMKKVSKLLTSIEDMFDYLEYGNTEMYNLLRQDIIRMSKSLTFEWLNEELELKKTKEQREQLERDLFIQQDVVDFSNLSSSRINQQWNSSTPIEIDWDSFDIPSTDTTLSNDFITNNTTKDSSQQEEIDWDSF